MPNLTHNMQNGVYIKIYYIYIIIIIFLGIIEFNYIYIPLIINYRGD